MRTHGPGRTGNRLIRSQVLDPSSCVGLMTVSPVCHAWIHGGVPCSCCGVRCIGESNPCCRLDGAKSVPLDQCSKVRGFSRPAPLLVLSVQEDQCGPTRASSHRRPWPPRPEIRWRGCGVTGDRDKARWRCRSSPVRPPGLEPGLCVIKSHVPYLSGVRRLEPFPHEPGESRGGRVVGRAGIEPAVPDGYGVTARSRSMRSDRCGGDRWSPPSTLFRCQESGSEPMAPSVPQVNTCST